MSTIINKVIDILTKQIHKLPQFMIIIFIFAALCPNEAVNVKDILNAKIQILLPESFIELLTRLQFSKKEILTIWAFLLIIFTITFILNIIRQLLKKHTYIIIDSAGNILFEINSVFFLLVLIYNALYYPGIEVSSINFNGIFLFLVLISAGLFALIFCMTYCADIILIFNKINNPDLSFKLRIMLNIIFWIIIAYILSKINNILFR